MKDLSTTGNAETRLSGNKPATHSSHRNKPDTTAQLQTTGVTTHHLSFDIDSMKYLVEPLKYEIFIHLNTNSTSELSEFYGNVFIELTTKEKVKYIAIGASHLGLIAVSLTNLEVSMFENVVYPHDNWDQRVVRITIFVDN